MNENKVPPREWREVVEMKDEFQKILKIMSAFEGHIGRYQESAEPELYFLRKAVSVCPLEMTRAFIREIGADNFYVILEMDVGGGYCATGYIHEDGLHQEKVERAEESEHPIHKMVSMTDIYHGGTRDVSESFANPNIGPDRIGARVRHLARDEMLD